MLHLIITITMINTFLITLSRKNTKYPQRKPIEINILSKYDTNRITLQQNQLG